MGLAGPLDGLRPDGPVGPVLHLAHGPDDAGLDPLADEPGTVVGVALVAHLGDDALLAGRRREGARLGDGARQRLLAVHVLAASHRLHRDDRVGVVGGGDDHGVEVGLCVEHAPVVGVGARLGIEGERARGVPEVDVAERGDVLAVASPHVAPPAPAHADAGDVQGVARRLEPAPAEHAAGHDHQGSGGRDPAEKAAAREGMATHAGTPPGSPARYGRRHGPIISWPVRGPSTAAPRGRCAWSERSTGPRHRHRPGRAAGARRGPVPSLGTLTRITLPRAVRVTRQKRAAAVRSWPPS